MGNPLTLALSPSEGEREMVCWPIEHRLSHETLPAETESFTEPGDRLPLTFGKGEGGVRVLTADDEVARQHRSTRANFGGLQGRDVIARGEAPGKRTTTKLSRPVRPEHWREHQRSSRLATMFRPFRAERFSRHQPGPAARAVTLRAFSPGRDALNGARCPFEIDDGLSA